MNLKKPVFIGLKEIYTGGKKFGILCEHCSKLTVKQRKMLCDCPNALLYYGVQRQ